MKSFVSRVEFSDGDNVISLVELVGLDAVEFDAHGFARRFVRQAKIELVADLLRDEIFIEQTFDLHAA